MFFLLSFFLIALDQAGKYTSEHFLGTMKISILGEYFSLVYVKNTGIAFSLPIEGLFLKAITILLILAIGVYFVRYEELRKERLVRWAYTLLLSGALSNGADRVMFGSVTDFIAVKYFAILNFADIFISVGALLLLIAHIKHERSAQK